MRNSLYWDDFEKRVAETVACLRPLQWGEFRGVIPVRRVAVFVTDKCNFLCAYCNNKDYGLTLSKERFVEVVEKYGQDAIIHITGGEPSIVPWLYPYIRENGHKFRFHLNSNGYITPPSEHIKRLKVSLDHYDGTYWDVLVGRSGAFAKVVENIKNASKDTIVSITYTLTKDNLRDAVEFARFSNREFPDIYALFFSVYKGINPKYMIGEAEADIFFEDILPDLAKVLPEESLALISETIDEKRRLMQGVRFPQNGGNKPCYISMSERVISPAGDEFMCSHLYRDRIYQVESVKHEKCLYGCNRRLVKFNEEVEEKLGA